jgi:prophage antirepressor-like protein
MDFKQFRTQRNLTQAQAGHLLGLSGQYWSELEAGKIPDRKSAAFIRVLRYTGDPRLERELTPERIKKVREYGLTYSAASVAVGSGISTISNLLNGCLPINRRWKLAVNALLIELDEANSPKIEAITPQVITEPEPEISDQGLMPFAYGSEKVRVKMVDGEPWFCLRDVCGAVGYNWFGDAPSLIDEEGLEKFHTLTSGGEQFILFVSEPGLYQFLARAKAESIKPFQNWLFKEVLPSIRKTGGYQTPQSPIDPLDAIILSLTEIKAVKAQQAQMAAMIESQQQQIKQIEARTPIDPRQSAKQTLLELQALNGKKAQLHKIKAAIVTQAERNTDDFSFAFRKHGNVWRYIHSQAVPPVARIDDYTTQAQLNTAIEAAQILLTRLGGALPQQLSIEIGEVA